jgi:C4-dicarboxylate transporter DctQ subunit
MRRFRRGLHQFEEYALTLTLLGMAVAACGQVFCRYALGISFAWFEESGRYLGIVITFLGAAIGARQGSHFAMDLFVNSVSPGKAKLMQAAIGLVSGSIMILVAVYGMKVVMRNYEYENTTAALQLPMYLIYLPISVFSAVIAVRFLLAGYAALCPKKSASEGGMA